MRKDNLNITSIHWANMPFVNYIGASNNNRIISSEATGGDSISSDSSDIVKIVGLTLPGLISSDLSVRLRPKP